MTVSPVTSKPGIVQVVNPSANGPLFAARIERNTWILAGAVTSGD